MQTTPPIPRRRAQRILPRWARWLAFVVLLALGGILLASLTQEPLRAAMWQGLGQRCGTVAAQDTPAPKPFTDPATTRQAEDCFMHGYAQCRAVSLEYSLGGTDYFKTHTFVVEPAVGWLVGCAVADSYQITLAGGGRAFTETDHCARVTQGPDGLHAIGCGRWGDIVISAS